MNDTTNRDVQVETAVNALQEAALLTGYLRRCLTDNMTDLGKLDAAIERAAAALRPGRDEKGGA